MAISSQFHYGSIDIHMAGERRIFVPTSQFHYGSIDMWQTDTINQELE